MNSRLKVMVNYFEANKIAYGDLFLKNNTDFTYPKSFKLLEGTDIDIVFNNSKRSFLHFLSFFSLQRLSEKLKVDLTRYKEYNQQIRTVYVPHKIMNNNSLFFSHGFFPVGLRKKGIPVLTNTGFMTNSFESARRDEDRWNEIKQICKMSNQSTIITFSTRDAIERFCSFVPEMRHKVRLAPFLIPQISKLTEDELYRKHYGESTQICFVGTDGKRKGLTNLLAAIRNIHEKDNQLMSDCLFSFVTRDPVVLPKDINFRHFKSLPNAGVLKIMRESDIFCMPTLKDAYGLVFLEAMGNGCAVLCDNDLPRKEIFNHSLACFTDPDSTSEIENGLRKLITDKEYRFNMAKDSYNYFNSHYSFDVVSSYYKHLFKETVDMEKCISGKRNLFPVNI